MKLFKDSDATFSRSILTEDAPLPLPKLPSISLPSVLSFDLHPLYASILENGAVVKKGDVMGLDGDLRRVLVAPFTGTVRLLVTGTGAERRVKVFLSEQSASFASRRN